ncbi:hypothetical protein [Mucilaginibacter humi]|uniref:hypothetical protein n=1 Tax=Mucilaginibacter humi TaxID=2732510 RepID=UPI001C2E8554|nr:hypothetical protein [Mucilaginibacter humi]
MNKLRLYFIAGLTLATLAANAQSPGAVIDVQHYGFHIQLSDATDNIKGKADILVKFLATPGSFHINLVKKELTAKA